MSLFTCDLLTIFLAVLIGIITYYKWSFTFWKRANVPYEKPSIPFGTSENPLARNEYIGFRIRKRYGTFKAKGYKHGGLYFFTLPVYLPIHPEYIKNIMAKDFHHFRDRGVYCNEKSDPLTANLFFLAGERWKTLRAKLTPAFTTSKLKLMFPAILQCCEKLNDAMKKIHHNGLPFEAKQVASCYTINVIGSCAFGLEINSFLNPENEFAKHGNEFFSSLTKLKSFSILISLVFPKIAQFFKIQTIPRDITNFFIKTIREAVQYREENNYSRKDFMQIMIDLKNSNEIEEGFTIDEMAAQSFAFFVAGYDSSSTTIAFCLYEIAKNDEIQIRVREEVVEMIEKHDGMMTYEAVTEMKYLDQVIDETLRKYPPVALMTRTCVEDYKVPDCKNTIIKKGTRVAIPIYAIHHDSDYYPNPDEFNPDRFTEEACSKRPTFVYLPFGAGPRVCTGLRIGLLQVKMGLAELIKHFKFSVNEKTKSPLEIQNNNFALKAEGGIWLNVADASNR